MANGTIAASQLEMLSQAGTGITTIVPPATNTNRTINLPDSNGTILTTATAGVPVNGPAFSAVKSALQAITNAVWTKVTFPIEVFDTNSAFNNTASTVGTAPAYSFNPQVAGYYQINAEVEPQVAQSYQYMSIYKNGIETKRNSVPSPAGTGVNCVGLVYLNGSTDYVEIYVNFASSININLGSAATYFDGFLARSAT